VPRLLRIMERLRFNRVAEMPVGDRTLFEDACRVRCVVLDEVGTEPDEVLETRNRRLLEELVDRRDNPGKVTAFTTNLSMQPAGEGPSDFARFVGARIVSRIMRSAMLRDCGQADLRRGRP
jgi:DNA replication protein DnaC